MKRLFVAVLAVLPIMAHADTGAFAKLDNSIGGALYLTNTHGNCGHAYEAYTLDAQDNYVLRGCWIGKDRLATQIRVAMVDPQTGERRTRDYAFSDFTITPAGGTILLDNQEAFAAKALH